MTGRVGHLRGDPLPRGTLASFPYALQGIAADTGNPPETLSCAHEFCASYKDSFKADLSFQHPEECSGGRHAPSQPRGPSRRDLALHIIAGTRVRKSACLPPKKFCSSFKDAVQSDPVLVLVQNCSAKAPQDLKGSKEHVSVRIGLCIATIVSLGIMLYFLFRRANQDRTPRFRFLDAVRRRRLPFCA